MALRRILCWLSVIGATACLAAGYNRVGAWAALVACLVNIILWGIALRRRSELLILISLMVSTALLALELLAGSSAWAALFGAAFSLAGMDLALYDRSLAGGQGVGDPVLLEIKHSQALVLALAVGLGLTGVGMTIHLNIPFIGMVVLVLGVFFCLEQVRRALSEK